MNPKLKNRPEKAKQQEKQQNKAGQSQNRGETKKSGKLTGWEQAGVKVKSKRFSGCWLQAALSWSE